MVGMSKGIFQSGSCGSCEKHSDVFHHIRYGQSPRAAVPHYSIEIPKPLLTRDDHREAETKIENRLNKEGYEHTRSMIRRFARAIKLILFIVVFLPYYLGFLLPLTIVSGLFTCVKFAVVGIVNPVVSFFESLSKRILGWFNAILWKFRVPTLRFPWKNMKFGIDLRFWKKWKIFTLNFDKFKKFQLPKITWKFEWNWKKWVPTLPKWKMPSFKFTLPSVNWKIKNPFSGFKFPVVRWSLPALPKLPKLPKMPKFPDWVSVSSLRKKIAVMTLKWNFKALAQFKFPKVTVFERGLAYLKQLADSLQAGFAKARARLPKLPAKVIQQGNNEVPISKASMLAAQVKVQAKMIVEKSANVVLKPVLRGLDNVQEKCVPVKHKLRKWTFLTIIAFELSLVLLSEAIMQFQEWNDVHWVNRLNLK